MRSMINKKIIAGILTVVVLLELIQTVAPVLAVQSDDSSATLFVTVSSGHGTVCWSGMKILSGCTQGDKYVSVPYETLIIFTATPAAGSTFIGWNFNENSTLSSTPTVHNYVSTNPYALPVPYGGEYRSVGASFTK